MRWTLIVVLSVVLLSGCRSSRTKTAPEAAPGMSYPTRDVTTVARLRCLAHEVGRRVKAENPEWSAEASELYDTAASWSNALLVYSTPNLGNLGSKAQAVAIAEEVEKAHTAFFAWAREKRPDLVLLSWQPPEEMADGIAEATADLFDGWNAMSASEREKCRNRLQTGYWRAFSDL